MRRDVAGIGSGVAFTTAFLALLGAAGVGGGTMSGCSSKSGDSAGGGTTSDAGASYAVLAPRSFAVESDPINVATTTTSTVTTTGDDAGDDGGSGDDDASGDDDSTTTTVTALTFATNAEIQSFQVGDTLAPANATTATNTPYIATITAIAVDSPVPGQTTFSVVPASLDDLFSEADIEQSHAVTTGDPNAVAPIDPTSPNILSQPLDLPLVPSGTLSPLDTFMALPSGGKTWSLGQGNGFIALRGGGTLDMSESNFAVSGGVDFAYQKQAGFTLAPDHVRLVFKGGISVTIGAKISANGAVSYSLPPKTWDTLPLGTIIVPAGPVPIPILVSVVLRGSGNVSLSGMTNMHEAVTGAFQMSAGVDYTSAGGTTGVFDHEGLVSYAPFTSTGKVTAAFRVVPLSASLHFSILGAAGPSVGISPSVGVQVASAADGGTPQVSGVYGISAVLGGELSVLGHEIKGVSVTLFSYNGTFPLCGAGSLVCSGGPLVASKSDGGS